MHGTLADDLADIYRDLKKGLELKSRSEPPETIIWGWRVLFYSHWGTHAIEALHVIHSRLEQTFLWTLYRVSAFRQARRFTPYRTMQKRLAGIKPTCAVLTPITHMMAELTPARTQPSQQRFPTKMVEITVNKHDK
jgi:hypothetical protein